MEMIVRGNLKITYENSSKDEITKVENFLDSFRFLFLDYIDSESQQEYVINIDDFDSFLINIIKAILNNDDFNSLLGETNTLMAEYIDLIVCLKEIKPFFPMDHPQFLAETIWFIVSCSYFAGDIDKIKDFIFNFNDEEKGKVFSWLRDKERYPTYNWLLDTMLYMLSEYDSSFFDNIDLFFSKMLKEEISSQSNLYYINDVTNEVKLAKCSTDEFEDKFFDFLSVIDAPKEWKDLYYRMKRENRLVFVEVENYSERTADHRYIREENGLGIIKVTHDGSVRIFLNFVHEFFHFIADYYSLDISWSLLEFLPIYFERVAAKYLVRQGFGEDIINYIVNRREQNNFDIFRANVEILKDLITYKNNGEITREEKIAPWIKYYQLTHKVHLELLKLFKDNNIPTDELEILINDIDYESAFDESIDANTELFLEEGIELIDGFQYQVGSYLANALLKRDSEILYDERLVNLCERLGSFNLSSIVEFLDIPEVFETVKKKKL